MRVPDEIICRIHAMRTSHARFARLESTLKAIAEMCHLLNVYVSEHVDEPLLGQFHSAYGFSLPAVLFAKFVLSGGSPFLTYFYLTYFYLAPSFPSLEKAGRGSQDQHPNQRTVAPTNFIEGQTLNSEFWFTNKNYHCRIFPKCLRQTSVSLVLIPHICSQRMVFLQFHTLLSKAPRQRKSAAQRAASHCSM